MHRTPSTTALTTTGLPSRMPWQDDSVARRLAALESLPPVSRRLAVRSYIAEREAELAVYAEAHPARPELRELRTGDELLVGLYLVDTLLAA